MNSNSNLKVKKIKALTLVEMAIVMVVMGFFLGIGLSLLKPLLKQQKVSQTRNIIVSARFSIIGYVISTQNLPDNLGQAGARASDAFGKPLQYIKVNLSDLCSTTTTGLSIKEGCQDKRCSGSTTISNVAVVIISGGENKNIQTKITNNGTINIYKPHVEVDDYPGDGTRIETYDDIVEYITISELKGRACPPPGGS